MKPPCTNCCNPVCFCSEEDPSAIELNPSHFEVNETFVTESDSTPRGCTSLVTSCFTCFSDDEVSEESEDSEEEGVSEDILESEEEEEEEEKKNTMNGNSWCNQIDISGALQTVINKLTFGGLERCQNDFSYWCTPHFPKIRLEMECFSRKTKNEPFDKRASCHYGKTLKIGKSKLFKFTIEDFYCPFDDDWELHGYVAVKFVTQPRYFYLSNLGDKPKLKFYSIETPLIQETEQSLLEFKFILHYDWNAVKKDRLAENFINEKVCIQITFRQSGIKMFATDWDFVVDDLYAADSRKYEIRKKVKHEHEDNVEHHTKIFYAKHNT